MTTLEERIAKAVHGATIHACPELDTTYCETMDESRTIARAVVDVLPLADVSDEAIHETLRAHEIGSNPRTCCYECPCGWQGTIAFDGRAEAEEHRAQAVRAALLDAQAAAHAAEVEALRAEVERLTEAVEYPQTGTALGLAWPIDRLAPDGVSWLDHYNAEVERRGTAEAERDAYRARIDAVRALAEPYTRTHINHDGSVSVGAVWWLARDILAALDGDA